MYLIFFALVCFICYPRHYMIFSVILPLEIHTRLNMFAYTILRYTVIPPYCAVSRIMQSCFEALRLLGVVQTACTVQCTVELQCTAFQYCLLQSLAYHAVMMPRRSLHTTEGQLYPSFIYLKSLVVSLLYLSPPHTTNFPYSPFDFI